MTTNDSPVGPGPLSRNTLRYDRGPRLLTGHESAVSGHSDPQKPRFR